MVRTQKAGYYFIPSEIAQKEWNWCLEVSGFEVRTFDSHDQVQGVF